LFYSLKVSNEKILTDSKHKLEILSRIIFNFDPKLIFKRGYTITKINNKIAKSVEDLKVNSTITTIFFDGEIESSISKIVNKENKLKNQIWRV